jgi:hypothetical protein
MVKRLKTNVCEDHEQEEMDLDLLMGEICMLKQTLLKTKLRIEKLEMENRGLFILMNKVLCKVGNLNRDVIQVGRLELSV